MIKIHDQPYTKTVCGTYRSFADDIMGQDIEIPKIILYGKNGKLESDSVGITKYIKIDADYFDTEPVIGDLIEIDYQYYKFIDVKLQDLSIVRAPFYQCSIKTVEFI